MTAEIEKQIENRLVEYYKAPMHRGDTIVLARLLVRKHNTSAEMDKALYRDTFGTLYRTGPYKELQEIEAQFNVPR